MHSFIFLFSIISIILIFFKVIHIYSTARIQFIHMLVLYQQVSLIRNENVNQYGEDHRAVCVASTQNCLKHFINLLLKFLTASLLLAKTQQNQLLRNKLITQCKKHPFPAIWTTEYMKEMATATKMQRWVSKSYQCFSSGPWSHLMSQAAASPSHESSEWAKATAYWEKTTTHSQALSSSLLKLTHKLQVHTRNLKITLLLEFKGSKLKISQASLQ